MEEDYEYANEFEKQGRKNPSILAILTYAHAQSFGI